MKKKIPLSFRKHPRETGLAAVGANEPSVDIKINQQKVGYIKSPNWRTKNRRWQIKYAVIKKDIMEDGNPNCVWKWITLKVDYETEKDARDSVKRNIKAITERYNLYYELP